MVERGVATLIHSSQGFSNPEFKGSIENGNYIKVYELILRTNWAPICITIQIRFDYDKRNNRACMKMSDLHATFLYMAYVNSSAEEQAKVLNNIIKYGEHQESKRIPVVIEK
jgi:hypothetical protein